MSNIDKDMDLEQSLAALKEAVEALENPSVKLEESMEIYDRASRLALMCKQKLENARLQITDIDKRVAQLRQAGADDISEA